MAFLFVDESASQWDADMYSLKFAVLVTVVKKFVCDVLVIFEVEVSQWNGMKRQSYINSSERSVMLSRGDKKTKRVKAECVCHCKVK